MASSVDERNLPGLLQSAGKNIGGLPQARRILHLVRAAGTPEDLSHLLQSLDIGLGEPARQIIQRAVCDPGRFPEVHATLVRAAEQSLVERFSPSA